jgi:hypothetical protein
VVIASIFRLVAVHDIDTSNNLSENYALVFLWAAVENHVGICAACAGAIKQKSIAAFSSVRRSYDGFRHKSPMAMVYPSELSRSQATEDRNLCNRQDSVATTASAPSINDTIDSKTSFTNGMRMELFEVSDPLGQTPQSGPFKL